MGFEKPKIFYFFLVKKHPKPVFMLIYDVTNQNRASFSPVGKKNILMNLVVANTPKNTVFLYHVSGEFFLNSVVP